MEYWMFLVAIPFATSIVAAFIWHHRITLAECLIGVAAGVLVTTVVYAAGAWSDTADREVRSGQVVSKERDRVSCSHSYSCRCRTVRRTSGTGKNRTTYSTTECDTCYRHSHDYDWNVRTTINSFTVSRVDSQGVETPPRWDSVKIGDPVADTFFFTNYIKAVPDTLVVAADIHRFKDQIPKYPTDVYDYDKVDRFVTQGLTVPNSKEWNNKLQSLNGVVGPAKEANVVVVVVNTADQRYFTALSHAWRGGKKNDAVVVVGASNYPKIDWVTVMSWTSAHMFKVKVRDDLMAIGTMDPDKIIPAIEENTKTYFVRRQMKDFEYLQGRVEPQMWVLVLAAALGSMCSLGVSYAAYKHELV